MSGNASARAALSGTLPEGACVPLPSGAVRPGSRAASEWITRGRSSVRGKIAPFGCGTGLARPAEAEEHHDDTGQQREREGREVAHRGERGTRGGRDRGPGSDE